MWKLNIYWAGTRNYKKQNCVRSKNNDYLQLLFILFSAILIFPVPILTQLNSRHQCFLLFNFTLKTGHVVFWKQFMVKNHNSFQSGLSDVPSSENAWISNFFRLHETYIYKEKLINLIKTFSFSNTHDLCINSWFSFHCISNVIQWGNVNKTADKCQHLKTFKSFCCKIVSRSWTNLHFGVEWVKCHPHYPSPYFLHRRC